MKHLMTFCLVTMFTVSLLSADANKIDTMRSRLSFIEDEMRKMQNEMFEMMADDGAIEHIDLKKDEDAIAARIDLKRHAIEVAERDKKITIAFTVGDKVSPDDVDVVVTEAKDASDSVVKVSVKCSNGEAIKAKVKKDELVVTTEMQVEQEKKNKDDDKMVYWSSQMASTSEHRTLPHKIDPSSVESSLVDGILTLSFQKLMPRKIEVTTKPGLISAAPVLRANKKVGRHGRDGDVK